VGGSGIPSLPGFLGRPSETKSNADRLVFKVETECQLDGAMLRLRVSHGLHAVVAQLHIRLQLNRLHRPALVSKHL
jgi:hypothetical protein